MIRKMLRFEARLPLLAPFAQSRTACFRIFASLVALLLLALPALAQPNGGGPEMADALRGDGKFWVVVVTIALVTAGMFAYMFRLEGKVRRLEERMGRRADGFIER